MGLAGPCARANLRQIRPERLTYERSTTANQWNLNKGVTTVDVPIMALFCMSELQRSWNIFFSFSFSFQGV